MLDLPGLWRTTAVSRRTAQRLASRLPDMTGVLLFVAQAFYYTIVHVVLRQKYRKTVVQHISDIMIGVGAYVMGVGLVFVMSVMALFIGATIGFRATSACSWSVRSPTWAWWSA